MDPELTPQEKLLAIDIRERDKPNLLAVAAAIGGAFLLYRQVMRRKLKQSLNQEPPKRHTLLEVNQRLFQGSYRAQFVATLVPSLIAGYTQGLLEVQAGKTNTYWVNKVATIYATQLADTIHETSAKALVDGFTMQMNRKVPARIAAERVIDAFGVTPRTMKALVNIWLGPTPEPSPTILPMTNRIADRADRLIEAAIGRRSEQFGENEAYVTKNQAKALIWLYQADQHPGSKVVWYTSNDERVCPVCGPMHGRSRDPRDQFTIRGFGKAWAPPLHPRCRCEILLAESVSDVKLTLEQAKQLQDVSKADFKEYQHPRARTGRFVAKPKPVMNKPAEDPLVAQMVAQLKTVQQEEPVPEKTGWAAPPSASTGSGWAAPSAGWRGEEAPQGGWATPAETGWSAPAMGWAAQGQSWSGPEETTEKPQQSQQQPRQQRWHRVPIKDAMFVLIPPGESHYTHAHETYTGSYLKFFKADMSGGEHPADQALRQYWSTRIFDRIEQTMNEETADEYRAITRAADGGLNFDIEILDEDQSDFTGIPEGSHRVHLSKRDYQKLWMYVIFPDEYGEKHQDSYMSVKLIARDEEVPVDIETLVDSLDIPQRVDMMKPMIGISEHVPDRMSVSTDSPEVFPPDTQWRITNTVDDVPDIPELGIYHHYQWTDAAYSRVVFIRPEEAED